MNRKILSLLIVIPLAIFGVLIYKNQTTTPQKSSAFETTPTPTINNMEIDGMTFSWFEINNIDKLKLIPNFTEKILSKDAMTTYKCTFLSNAGFYSKDNKPIGLFISDGRTIANWQDNSLFDGLLSINDMSIPRITRNIPQDHLQSAVQTGPILKENNNYINLKIIEDKESRRVIAFVTGENKLFFMVIYNSNSEYNGSNLANVPTLLAKFEKQTEIKIADAINLDGGFASTFNSPSIQLSEFNPAGAFFCQL